MSLDGPELPEARKAASGHRVFDLLISFCALFMSGVSIFMAYHTSHSMENLVHTNSWPFLQIESGNYNDRTGEAMIVLGAKNAGTGVARIETFELFVDGAPVDTPPDLFEACCPDEFSALRAQADDNITFEVFVTANLSRTFLPSGETSTAIAWPRPEGGAAANLWRAFDQARQARRITMRACYCSAFDECWRVESAAFRPVEVHACPAPRETAIW